MTTTRGIINIGPDKAKIQEISIPELKPDYIKVRPTAWAINPDDVYHLGLTGEESCVGLLVGSDYAGTVVEVGSDVTRDFKIGDRIAGVVSGQDVLHKSHGAFAGVIVVKGDIQMKIPDNMSDGVGLYRTLGLPLPEEPPQQHYTVFIYGGSTAMGISAIQFAKLSAATVITTSSPFNTEYLKSLGADHVLDYRSATLVDDVLRIAEGPVQYAFENFPSDASAATSASVLSRSGNAKYVSLIPGFEKAVKKLNPLVDAQSILAFSAFGEPWMYEKEYYNVVPGEFEFQKRFVQIAERLFAGGKLKAPRVFLNRGGSGFEGILYGLNEVRNRNVSGGKLVYTPNNDVQG
ncbi:hypothetical protein FGRMN_3764 [Fusarium graminum]|nr:hypothetical protein FGRMN_3764 [Fusarium graminum]